MNRFSHFIPVYIFTCLRVTMDPLIIILFGRSGCGKGTQAELLLNKLGLIYLGSGKLLRKKAEIDGYSGKKIGETLERGGLIPTSIVSYLWMDHLEEIKANENENFKGILFDGSPRKLVETKILEEALNWYGWDKNVKVVLLDISRDEAARRLALRQREDDTPEAIKERLDFFEEEVVPIINYYKEKGLLIIVNGEQPIESTHQEVLEKLGLK